MHGIFKYKNERRLGDVRYLRLMGTTEGYLMISGICVNQEVLGTPDSAVVKTP